MSIQTERAREAWDMLNEDRASGVVDMHHIVDFGIHLLAALEELERKNTTLLSFVATHRHGEPSGPIPIDARTGKPLAADVDLKDIIAKLVAEHLPSPDWFAQIQDLAENHYHRVYYTDNPHDAHDAHGKDEHATSEPKTVYCNKGVAWGGLCPLPEGHSGECS